MPRLTLDEHRGRTRPQAGPATPTSGFRLNRRGRVVLAMVAATLVVLVIVGITSVAQMFAGPDQAVAQAEPVATVDPTCVPTSGTSQNCWPAILEGNDDRLVQSPWITGRVLGGDVQIVLDYVAERFDATVEPVDPDASWGWAYRSVRGEDEDSGEDEGGGELSNHASGTSIDLNATDHPLGVTGTFTDDQIDAIHDILAEVSPVVAWGGEFDGRVDEMHFEIVGDADAVAEVAARLNTQ